ncbi:MAG TPA: preprotein translocase subunit SecG [Bryobacteraceae bacterium]|nr:preprotein translocase subunit SecG [Bryobacteraceae bacterium]
MVIVLTILHILICFFMIVVVLLQSGQAADLAGAFGGMGSQTAFGPRGSATILSKATTIAAALFMVTSMSLAILATRAAKTSGSVLGNQKAPITQPANKQQTPAPLGTTPSGGNTIPLPSINPQTAPAQSAPAAPAQSKPAGKK